MNIDNPISLIRQLKGAPLSILFAMSIARQPVNESWLVEVTGYTDKPVIHALNYLEELQFITRISRFGGWSLMEGATQLPIGIYENESELFQFPDSIISISLNRRSKGVLLQNTNNNKTNRNYSSSIHENLTIYQQNCRNLLMHLTVEDPKATKLALLEKVTIRAIIGTFDYLFRMKKDGGWKDIGLLIYRLEQGNQIPRTSWEYDVAEDKPDREFFSLKEAQEYLSDLESRAQSELIEWQEIMPK